MLPKPLQDIKSGACPAGKGVGRGRTAGQGPPLNFKILKMYVYLFKYFCHIYLYLNTWLPRVPTPPLSITISVHALKILFICLFRRFINHFALCILFGIAMSTYCNSKCTHADVTVIVDYLVNKTREKSNWVMLFL